MRKCSGTAWLPLIAERSEQQRVTSHDKPFDPEERDHTAVGRHHFDRSGILAKWLTIQSSLRGTAEGCNRLDGMLQGD